MNHPDIYRDTAHHYANDEAPASRHARDRLLDIQAHAGPAIDRLTSHAGELARRGAEALRDGSYELRERTLRASHSGLEYVRHEPVKAALLTLGVLAAAITVISLLNRSR